MFNTIITCFKSMLTSPKRTSVAAPAATTSALVAPAATPSAFVDPCQMQHGLSAWDVSDLKCSVADLPGSWTVTELPSCCACDDGCICNGMDVTVTRTREQGDPRSPVEFAIYTEDGLVSLYVSWLDGREYLSEFWSVPSALAVMRSMLAEAAAADMEVTV